MQLSDTQSVDIVPIAGSSRMQSAASTNESPRWPWHLRLPCACTCRAWRRRSSRPSGHGARITISIRVVFVGLSILFVAGAISFSWAFTYSYATHNVRELTGALLDEAKVNARAAVTGFLATARQESYRIAAEFDAGRLSEGRWRQVLESLSLNVAAFPEVSSHLVRFASGNVFGVLPCRSDVGASSSCVNPEIFIENGTHRYTFMGSERGQPIACSGSGELLALGSEIYNKVAASRTGSAWHGLSSVRANIPALHPLDRMRMRFGLAFRGGPSVYSTSLDPDLELPEGIPASPQPLTSTSTSLAVSPLPAPIAGIASVALSVGVLSNRLSANRLARNHAGLLVITDGAGVMIASSTADAAHLLDASLKPIQAANSPHALTRALVAEASRRSERETESESFDSFTCEGRTMYYVLTPITVPDGIEWHLYMAVPEEAVTSRLRRSIFVISIANSLWLLFAVTMAALTAAAITRPIDRLHSSLTTVVETISAMTRDMADARRHGKPPLAAAASEKEAPIQLSWSGSRAEVPVPVSRSELESAAPAMGLRELARFGPLLKDVQERFAVLQRTLNGEMQLQMEMKVRAEQTKRMLGTMSHEMRTPLNGILGMLELALDQPLPGEAAAHLRAAVDCADHLFALITDLLDFQRISAGAVQLRSVPVDVREVVSAVVRVMGTQSRVKGIPVRSTVDSRVPALFLCDPGRLRQILINLVGNALKYSDAGAVDLRVQIAPPELNAPMANCSALCIEVEDQGRGIPADALALLFSPFYRAHAETDAKLQDPGGTGLGLAICKDLVERLGGEISCVSRVGEAHGSTFRVFLPLQPCARPSTPSPRPQPTPGPATLGEVSIGVCNNVATYLIADDDAINRRVTEAGLRSAGHTVVVTCDGAEALRAFEDACGARPSRSPFDAILMDCLMPRMDGMQASRAIRAAEARLGLPRCPIVAYTSFGDPEGTHTRPTPSDESKMCFESPPPPNPADEANCFASGMDVVLTKPARKKDLLAKLDAVRGCSGPPETSSSAGASGSRSAGAPFAATTSSTLELVMDSAPVATAVAGPMAGSPPAAAPPAPAPALAPSSASCSSSPEWRGAPSPQSRQPLDVLVVDDVEMNRRVLGGLLRREGHAVEMAGDGEEAVAAFAARARAGRPYALVLMDVAMPKLDGIGAARAIRALECEAGIPPAKRTPIFACTASLDEDQTRQAGMDLHLLKPITRATLAAALEQLIPIASGANSNAESHEHVQMKPLSLDSSPALI